MKRLAIITTHPIQYNAPLFNLLSERNRIELKVFYTWSQSRSGKLYDPGFAKSREWDIPLLEGYDYVFVHNKSKDPGSHHFLGIINPDLIQMIELYNPDAILVYGWNFYSHLRILRHFNGKICLLFRGDSTLLNETYRLSIKKIFRRILLRWVYSHVDKAFYVGTSNKEYFLACGLQTAQLIYAPHAIDNDRFMAEGLNNEVKALEWRNKLGIYDSDILFLFAGKLEFQKNPFLLLEAFNSLTSSNIKLLIVGNGPLEEKLKKVSQNNKRVIFLDFQNQQIMPIIYRLGDVMILPSISETWGLSVNEAMACGRPVIVSDACGCEKDLIIHGITGYSFRSGNVFDLVKCMSLLSDKKKVIAMRDAVLKFIQSFNYSRVAQSIENNI